MKPATSKTDTVKVRKAHFKSQFVRLLTLIILTMTVFTDIHAAKPGKSGIPDFAYPQDALKQSEAMLEAAEKSGDSEDICRAALYIFTAKVAVDPKAAPEAYTLIKNLREKEAKKTSDKGEAGLKAKTALAVLDILSAQILDAVYQDDSYKYDNTQTPLTPLPENIAEWNGRQFTSETQRLVDEAVDLAGDIRSVPLSDYKNLLSYNRDGEIVCPDMGMFVIHQALRLGNDKSLSQIIDKGLAICTEGSWSWASLMTDKSRRDSYAEMAENLMALYRQYPDYESSAMFLHGAGRGYINAYKGLYVARPYNNNSLYLLSPKEFVSLIDAYLRRFPSSYYCNNLKNLRALYLQPKVNITGIPSLVYPGQNFELKVAWSNARSLRVAMLDEDSGKEIKTIKIPCGTTLPYSTDTTLILSIPVPGRYGFRTRLDDHGQEHYSETLCVPFVPVSIGGVKVPEVFVADLQTGSPLDNASVIGLKTDIKGKIVSQSKLGLTSDEGIAKINAKIPRDISYLRVKKGAASFDFEDVDVSADNSREKSQESFYGLIFTDRKLYHRGDKVEFTFIGACSADNGVSMRPLSRENINIYVRDANHEPLDTFKVETDDMGQYSGSFILPEECLTGNFSINASIKRDKLTRSLGYGGFTVSDFKLPSFEVKITDIRRDVPGKGEVTIDGRAQTYTGMGVGGAEVAADIFQASRWRFFFPSRQLGTVKTTTGNDGGFSFVVPDSILSENDLPGHNYFCRISVTNQAGEAQYAEKGFTTGKPFVISMPGSDNLKINTESPVSFGVRIYDANGREVSEPLVWRLSQRNKEMASGEMSGPEAKAVLSSLPGGIYDLEIVTINPELADTLSVSGISLYNIDKGLMPDNEIIFLPKAYFDCGQSRSAKVTVGLSSDDISLYIARIDGRKISYSRVERHDRGFFDIPVNIPASVDESLLILVAVKDGEICIRRANAVGMPDRALNITASSFRDRISPGAKEKWTFKIAGADAKAPGKARMAATMYNAALNALADNTQWSNRFSFNHRYSYGFTDSPDIRTFSLSAYGKYPTMLTAFSPQWPAFNPAISLYGNVRFLYEARASEALENVVIRGVSNKSAVMRKSSMVAAALGGAVNGLQSEATADDMVEEEVAVDEEKGDGGETAPEAPQFSYRPAETLQAFWMPAVKVDSDGTALVEFSAPDNIGSWSLNMFAWDEQLRSGNFSAIIQATKPVMVTPQAPRFLRRGDRAVVVSTVYNNSDSLCDIEVISEKFDLISGKTLDSAEENLKVEAGMSATSSFSLTAGAGEESVGFRVKAVSGSFSDGEQVLVPVLEAYSEVIEGESYWLNPGDDRLDVTLPGGKNALTVFAFNDNPAWDVIKILPALSKSKPYSAPEAAEALFEAYTSSGIVNRNKEVAIMLKDWLSSPEDSALVSKLSQNDALKQASLNLTPWTHDASSDTRRMASLALLLDSREVIKSIETSMKSLRKFQTPEGGFKWGEWSDKPSMWATWTSLNALCRLRLAGYWPKSKELDEMVIKAVRYYENQLSPLKAHLYQPGYAYGVSVMPGKPETLKGRQILDYTLKKMSADWKTMSPTSKARAAITLSLNGYRSTAEEIMKSLDQFAAPAGKGKGSFIPRADIDEVAEILLAYATVNPQSPRVNELRQWLVARTAVTTQLGAWDPTLLAAAFMATGAKWTVPVGETSLTVNGVNMALPVSVRNIGSFSMQIPAKDAGKALSLIRGNTAGPAYGSVFTRAQRPTTEVKAKSCDEISIDKKIMLVDGTGGKYVTSLKLGQKVRILLTIKAENDLEYVTVIDQRPACLQPVDQLPGLTQSGSVWFYRENGDSETRLFIDYLPRGVYTVAIDMTVGNAGDYISGLATAQSQLAPAITAHSAGSMITVAE